MNTVDISYPKGRYNPAGITKVWYAFPEDILTFPTLADPATATTFSSLVEYTTAIIMAEGKQFRELYCTLETGEVKAAQVGPRDGKGYENSVTISFPGNDSLFLGFKAYMANRDAIFIVREKNGKLRVLGNLEDTALMDADDEKSGQKIADGRASVVTFKASGATSCPIYTVAIDSLLIPGEDPDA